LIAAAVTQLVDSAQNNNYDVEEIFE
jgi:hypothetical protein